MVIHLDKDKQNTLPMTSAPSVPDFTRVSDEVFYTKTSFTQVGRPAIEFLKQIAAVNPRRRSRLCTHPDMHDSLHEMIIVHPRNTYVRPHKHMGKSESFHVIEGTVNVVLFDEAGKITDVLPMGDAASGLNFYYRMATPCYHSLLITSEILVFHEITNGPFRREDTVFAPWAPLEEDTEAVKNFMSALNRANNGGSSSQS